KSAHASLVTARVVLYTDLTSRIFAGIEKASLVPGTLRSSRGRLSRGKSERGTSSLEEGELPGRETGPDRNAGFRRYFNEGTANSKPLRVSVVAAGLRWQVFRSERLDRHTTTLGSRRPGIVRDLNVVVCIWIGRNLGKTIALGASD